MASPTIVKIGAWDPINSVMIPHPSCPTGLVFDINDGSTFSLVDSGGGRGDGLDIAEFEPNVFTGANPRVVGEKVWRRIYNKNRLVTASLAWMGTSYTTWIAAKNNLETLLEGITERLPAVLQVRTTLSATPVYFDIVEAHIWPPYGETHWAQMQEDAVKIKFTCKPRIRLPRVTLQNLVNNPGFEAPSGPGVLCFNDNLFNGNAYAVQAGGALGVDKLAYPYVITADAPLRYFRFDEPSGSTAYDATAHANATLAGGTLYSVTGALMGDSDTACNPNSVGSWSCASAGLPTGSNAVTLECWLRIPGTPASNAIAMSIGTNVNGQHLDLGVNTSKYIYATNGSVTAVWSSAISLNTWYHVVVSWDGVNTIAVYVNGLFVAGYAGTTMNLTYGDVRIGALVGGGANFFTGPLDECAIYSGALSPARIAAHWMTGSSIYAAQAMSLPPLGTLYTPGRYYRLGEKSGTTAYNIVNPADSSTQGIYTGSPTLNVTGALSGDPDTAVTFNGTTQYCSIPTTGLPSGNAAWSMVMWLKFASVPGSNRFVFDMGTSNVQGQHAGIVLHHTAGAVYLTTDGYDTPLSSALSTGVWHQIVGTYDGTTLRLYVDGAFSQSTVPGVALTLTYGYATIGASALASPASFLPGSVDEVAVYNCTLTLAQISQLYTLGTNASTATQAYDTMTIPASGRVMFGAPWLAMQTWQVRLRYLSSLTANFYFSWFNTNNTVDVQITGTALSCIQTVAGTPTTISTAADTLVNGVDYWLTISVFPQSMNAYAGIAGCFVQAQLAVDSNGAPGTTIATLNPTAIIYGTNLTQPQISASGAALALSSNKVYQFGPGGWNFLSYGSSVASLLYDQRPGYQYTAGPITSAASAMIQVPPTGDFAFLLKNMDDTSAATIQATAVPTKNAHVIGYSVKVNSTGLGAGGTQYLTIYEYDINGNYLRQTNSASLTGNQSWATISGTVTTGASTAFVGIVLAGNDATSGSANGSIWFDNVQMWDQTTTQATMPYCELRFSQSLAHIMVSGLQGTVPSPAIIAMTGYRSTFTNATSMTFWMGRRSSPSSTNTVIALPVQGDSQSLLSTAYGGAIRTYNSPASSAGYDSGFLVSDLLGGYHRYARATITSGAPTTAGLAWMVIENSGLNIPAIQLPATYPFAAAATWTIADGGLVTSPGSVVGSRVDPTGIYQQAQLAISNATAASIDAYTYLPNDTETFVATMTASSTRTNVFATAFWDGINQSATSSIVSATLYQGIGWTPNYAGAINAYGPALNGGYQFTPVCDAIPQVDPQQRTSLAYGVNEWLLMIADNSGGLMPCSVEVSYEPTYLWPI